MKKQVLITLLSLTSLLWSGAVGEAFAQNKTIDAAIEQKKSHEEAIAKIKVIYLYNISKNIVSNQKLSRNKYFEICVLGGNEFLIEQLNKLVSQKQAVDNRNFKIINSTTISEINSPDILYVNALGGYYIDEINKKISGKPILLITDNYKYLNNSMICFLEIDNKIKFAINSERVKKAGFVISDILSSLSVNKGNVSSDSKSSSDLDANSISQGIVSEKDWNSLFEKYEKQLGKSSNRNIKVSSNDLSSMINDYKKSGEKTLELEKKLIEKENKLKSLADSVNIQKNLLTKSKKELLAMIKSAKKAKMDLISIQREILLQSNLNSKQIEKINNQQEDISSKSSTINEQSSTINRQNVFLISSIVILLLIVSLLFLTIYQFKQKKKTHKEIAKQKELIEEKQKEILDSINYAKRLQEAILPQLKMVKHYLPESFIFYKPKDIVAGDFYWMEIMDDKIFIAAADCTGHGVPGAMVSVVCSNAMNRVVKEFGIIDTGKILDKVSQLVVETFEKSESDVNDGMDISICSFNNKTNELTWSGANNPLWLIRNSELIEFKPNKQPIGKVDKLSSFVSHTIQLQKNDVIYLFTDGFSDQFGGEKGKKFKHAQLKKLLLKNNGKTMDEQINILETTFNNWKGNLEQVDDVLLIGIKI